MLHGRVHFDSRNLGTKELVNDALDLTPRTTLDVTVPDNPKLPDAADRCVALEELDLKSIIGPDDGAMCEMRPLLAHLGSHVR